MPDMKNVNCQAIITILSCTIFIACGNAGNKGNSVQNTSVMDSLNEKIEANKKLAHLWIEDGWNNNRNKEVVAQVFANNWVDGNPTFPDQPKGIDGAMYFVEQYRKALSDIHFTFTHIIADADYVTFRVDITATHSDTLLGIPATGKKVAFTAIVIHKVENGRFAKSWNEVDLLGLKMQLEQK